MKKVYFLLVIMTLTACIAVYGKLAGIRTNPEQSLRAVSKSVNATDAGLNEGTMSLTRNLNQVPCLNSNSSNGIKANQVDACKNENQSLLLVSNMASPVNHKEEIFSKLVYSNYLTISGLEMNVSAALPPTASIQVVTGVTPGNSVSVDVTLTDFITPVSGFQYTIRFDTNYLKYVSTTNWAAGVTGIGIQHNYYGSIDAMTFVWGDAPVSISGLFNRFNFIYKASASGCTNITWSDMPTPRLFADDNYNELDITYVNGQVCSIATCAVNLTSAAGTDAQSKCISTPITNITYATTVATGATVTGLPAGVTGSWASDVVTISGTPTATGTYTYTVATTGCGPVSTTGTITVLPNNTITLTAGGNQSVAINSAITTTLYSTTGATGATVTGLPDGVTGSWASNVVTISGTPTATGTYIYTVTLTGGCGTVTANGTITVTPPATPTATIGTVNNVCPGDLTYTDITLSNFTVPLSSFQFTIRYDTNYLHFVNVSNWAAGIASVGIMHNYYGSIDALTFVWGDNPVSVNGQFFRINYRYKSNGSGCQNIIWSDAPTGRLFADDNYNILSVTYVTGAICSLNQETITGTTPLCVGTSDVWTSTTTGGTWTSSDPSIATVGSTSGQVNAIAVGTSVISYSVTVGSCVLTATQTVTVSAPTPQTISGTDPVCIGSSAIWASTTTGGTWSSSNPSVATIDPSTGSITGVAEGTAIISYALTEGPCASTTTRTVTISSPTTQTITGTTPICEGSSETWSCTTGGGTWTSSAPSIASVDASTGVVTGVSAGTALITYSVTVNGCVNTATRSVTIGALTAQTITGTSPLCEGSTDTWTSTTAGGTWTSSDPSVATVIAGSGLITGVAAGTSIITYSVTIDGCVNTATKLVSITAPVVQTISGTTPLCVSATDTWSSTSTGGTWTSSDPSVATVDASSGLITGIAAGTAVITYSVTIDECVNTATKSVTISSDNTVTLTAGGTQSACLNAAITTTTYATTGATDATVTGLPSGVNGSWASDVVTITGTPSVTGTYTYTVTLTGGCGSVTTTGTITVDPDNTMTLTAGGTQMVAVNTPITTTTYATTGATGATVAGLPAGVTGSWASDVVTISGTPTVTGVYVYTVTTSGGCGVLTSTGTLTITGSGSITALCQNINLPVDAMGNASITPAMIDNGSYAVGGIASMSVSPNTFNCSNLGPNVVTLTVTDMVGNTGTCEATVTVLDNILPTISCPANIDVNNAGVCGAQVTYNVTYNDNCPGAVLSQTAGLPSGALFPIGTTTNIYNVQDLSGNSAACSFTVTVTDNTPPNALCKSASVNLDITGNASVSVTDVNDGSNDECGISTMVVNPNSFTCANIGPNTVTLTVTDNNGNTATCSSTVTVVDNILPNISCPININVDNTTGSCGAVVTYTVTHSDDCPGDVLSQTAGLASGSTFPIGTTTNVFVTTDASGNSATCSFTVTVNDKEPLQIACPANITVNNTPDACTATVNYSLPSFTDMCPTSVTNTIINGSFETGDYTGWTLLSTSTSGTWGIGLAGQTLNIGDPLYDYFNGTLELQMSSGLPYTFMPTDGSHMGVFLQSGPANHRMYQDVTLPNGNISLNLDLGYSDHSGSFSPIQYLAINLRNPSTDALIQQLFKTNPGDPLSIPMTPKSFNISAYSGQNVRLEIVEANISAGFLDVMFDNIRINGDAATLNQSAGLASGADFPVGTTTNTYVVTDVNGNSASCSFTVTVNDNQLPQISCPAPISVNAPAGSCGVAVNYTVTYSDNCPGATLAQTGGFASGSIFPVGTTNNIYVVTDAVGNSATCNFDVVVTDNTPPSAICKNASVTLDSYGNASITPADVNNGSSDACGIASMSVNPNSFTSANIGNNIVTLTVTDNNGNTATCTATVTVNPSGNAPTATIASLSQACMGVVSAVNISLNNFAAPISGFQFSVRYDTNYIHFNDVSNWAPGISGVGILHNYYGTVDALTFVWGDTPTAISGVLCQLNLTYKSPASGCHNITWSDAPTQRLFADDNYNEYIVTYIDGNMCPLAPETISGTTSLCVGSTATWTSTNAGGTWSSSDPSIATIDPVTGLVSGIAAGTSSISYTVTVGSCVNTASQTVTITAPTAQTITGNSPLCIGATDTYTSTTAGGTWASSDPSFASIDPATGFVSAISAGSTVISYVLTEGVCTSTTTKSLTITAPIAQTITGTSPVCIGATANWTSTTAGGTWSSTDPSVASIDPATGVVTGVAAGSAVITYSVTVDV